MRQKSVVVLESNEELRRELKEALESAGGFRVEYEGDDGERGLEEIRRIRPDVAIVGMFLKGRDGSGVIRAMKKEEGNGKILATGIGKDALIEKAMGEGADYYLVKPFSMEGALEQIEEKGYGDKYSYLMKPGMALHKVGISFSSFEMKITDYRTVRGEN